MKKILFSFVLAFGLVAGARADDAPGDVLAQFSERVRKTTLANGMRILVVERPATQTISFAMYIRTGGLDDDGGKSGLAHMFEHMLFKGTKTIGIKDHLKEGPLLEKMDEVELSIQTEKSKGVMASTETLTKLSAQMEALNAQHEQLLVPEEYWQIYEQAGAEGLNASTGYDFTNYVVSLPKNYLKLWFAMESDRLRNPVLREFYKERSVVLEERRLRIDTNPGGKLWEAFLGTAFMAHPYGRPIVGWESDVSRIVRADAVHFFKQHYDVSRLVVAIVGQVDADEIFELCKIHFESIPSNPARDIPRIPVEPKQEGERRVTVEFDAEPSLVMGFHRPDMRHPDAPALSALEDVLSFGRSSRLNKEIVENKKVAVSVWASASGPGERDPNLFLLGGTPRNPHTPQTLERALLDEIAKVQKNPPTDKELEKVKNNLEASVIRGLSSNSGLASQLGYFESLAGDWQFVLELIRGIRQVTAADIQRVAQTYLTESNRTVAILMRKNAPQRRP